MAVGLAAMLYFSVFRIIRIIMIRTRKKNFLITLFFCTITTYNRSNVSMNTLFTINCLSLRKCKYTLKGCKQV